MCRRGVETAQGISADALPGGAALQAGDGSEVADGGYGAVRGSGVPHAISANFEAALRSVLEVGGGDVDTVCAIVGGVVRPLGPRAGIPPEWLAAREPLQLAAPAAR